jgi:hypothetical protein
MKRMMSRTLWVLGVAIIALLLMSPAYATVLCSYKGYDVSEHYLQLSNVEVSGDTPVKVGDKVSVSFTLTNVGKTSVTFDDKYGIFIAAEDPDGKSRAFGSTYQGLELLPQSDRVGRLLPIGKKGYVANFKADLLLDKEGTWILWPSYCVKTEKRIQCGPEDWHSCKIKVKEIEPEGGVSWVPFISGASPGTLSLVSPKSRDTMGLCVYSTFFGMYKINATVNNTQFHRLNVPNAGHSTVVGEPAVPVITRYFEVPSDVDLSVEILYQDEHLLDGYNVIPAQEPPDDVVNATPSPFALDEAVYTTDAFFPSYTASLEGENGRDPIIIRGHRIVALSFYPVQFNPVTQQLKAHSVIEVRLNYNRPAQVEPIDERLKSLPFDELSHAFILNYAYRPEGSSEGTSPLPSLVSAASWSDGAEYLIITHDSFFSQVLPLADWKERKGLITKIVNTSEIAPSGPTADEIADYIQDAYDTWNPAPSYVLLVGDSDFIPTFYRNPHPSDMHGGFNTASDLYYTTVDGPDYFPDIYIGRLSVDTAAQATTIINKILNYERNPPNDADFYTHASACAFFQDEDVWVGPPWNMWVTRRDGFEDRRFVLTSEEIRDYLQTQGYSVERVYCTEAAVTPTNYSPAVGDYYSWNNGDPLPVDLLRPVFAWNGDTLDITNALNDGRFLIYHRDHGISSNFWNHLPAPNGQWWGWLDGWGDPPFDTGDVAGLTNGDLLPLVLSIECQSGWFDGEIDQLDDPSLTRNFECFCEDFTRHSNGGAIAAIGATRNSKSGYNDEFIKGSIDAIWPGFNPAFASGGLFHLGQVLTYGEMYMANVYGYAGDHTQLTFELFHLFGDPELAIWTVQPEALDVTHPAAIGSGGLQEFVVTVKDGTDVPVHHAKVCLRKENEIHEVAYTDPAGQVFFNIIPSSGGQMNITVTKHNYRPYEGTITVTHHGATLSVDPASGPSGIFVDLAGSGFYDSETVTIDFDGTTTTATASGGSFTLSDFAVPDGAVGYVTVIAEGQTSGRTAVTLFRRLPDQPLPDPYIYCQWDPTTWHLNPGGSEHRVWDNPCVQLFDRNGDPVSSNDLEVMQPYTIRATIYNNATVAADDTDVTFQWAPWGAGQITWYPIDTIRVTVPAATETESGQAITDAVAWTPSLTGHTCLLVTIHHPWDENLENNKGQENTDVHHVSSPGEISFPVSNPTKETALVYIEVRQLGGPTVWPAILTREYPQIQEYGEEKEVRLMVDAPPDAAQGELRIFTATAYINDEIIGGIETHVDVRRETQVIPVPVPIPGMPTPPTHVVVP